MKKIWIPIIILLAIVAVFVYGYKASDQESADLEESLSYFIDSLTENVKATVENYEELGLAGGVDGFSLIKTYPGLRPSDFINVQAYQGVYSVENDELVFTGNSASDSAVLMRDGMRTLLNNCSERLGISPNTKSDIDRILVELEGR